MNNVILRFLAASLIVFFGTNRTYAQELKFQYDQAGNQVERKFMCINCTTYPVSLSSADMSSADIKVPNENKQVAVTDRKLVVFPNPVSEILTVKWYAVNGIYLQKLEVFSSTGVRFFYQESDFVESPTESSISFQKQTPGLYILRATYSDGKQELIKLIKK